MLCTYWIKELRSLFRDRNILLYGLLLPVFLYPTLLFGITQIKLYTQGLHEKIQPAVALVDSQDLLRFLREKAGAGLRLQTLRGNKAELLRNGSLDLVITPLNEAETYRIEYDSGRGDSLVALERVMPLMRSYGKHVEVQRGVELGIPASHLASDRVREVDVVDPERSTRFLLSMILPLVLIVMCTFGATYPAVELTAGERERRCAETTILLPLPRARIALGKSLAVTTAAFLALLVNLCAMLLSAGPMLASVKGGTATLPGLAWKSLPLIVCYGALLSVVLSNLFLLVGSYAKNYREAQAYVTPLQVVVMLPALLTLLPGTELDPMTAVIPIYNVGLAFRESLLGHLRVLPVVLSLASLGLFSLICFRATVRRLSDTAFVLGFHDPDGLEKANA